MSRIIERLIQSAAGSQLLHFEFTSMVRHMLNDSQLFLCLPRRILPQDKIACAIAEFNGNDTDRVRLDSIICACSKFAYAEPIADSPVSGIQFRLRFG